MNLDLQGIKHRLQRWRWYRLLHLIYTNWRARHGGLPYWSALLKGNRAENIPINRELGAVRVLIATGAGGHLPSMTLESLLGMALKVRHKSVEFLLCDGVLPACMMCEVRWYNDSKRFVSEGPTDRCPSCHGPSEGMLATAGFRQRSLGQYLSPEDKAMAQRLAQTTPADKIALTVEEGVPVGEHAMAGALRFFARGDLNETPDGECVLRRYFEAALLSFYAFRRLLQENSYKVVVVNHGLYVPQGIFAETAKSRGIRVVTWHPAYRRGCFIFNHGETYHHGLMNEPVGVWENMPWDEKCEEKTRLYLKSRRTGQGDWIRFHSEPEEDLVQIQKITGIDFTRPTIGLLTNVVWDAQLHYRANAFPSMMDWLLKTIRYFQNRPDLQLIVRVHPAEVTGTVPSCQPALAEIQKAFPRLPLNVRVIPPESRLSTYAAMAACNAVLIYGTKTGVELAATGTPVIVAGEAWVKNKGITQEANSQDHYFQLLDSLPFPSKLSEKITQRALKYAFHFFFRRMIPLEGIKEKKGWPPFQVAIHALDELMPGRSKGLDVICQGILEGTPFIYPAELEVGDEKQDTKKDGVPFCASA
jgi:hypothetical protein